MKTETTNAADASQAVPPKAREMIAEAMRRANTYLHAQDRCQRRTCRNSGKCHLRLTEDLAFDCGAGLTVLGQDIGTLALDLALDFVKPSLAGMENALCLADLWLEHNHLIQEQLEADRKARKQLYSPPL